MKTKQRKFLMTWAAAAASLVGAHQTMASIVYQYVTYTPPAAVTTYVTTPGVAVQIPIYLYESLSGGSTSLITADGGLYGGGFSVAQTSANAGLATIALSGNSSGFPGNSASAIDSTSKKSFQESNGNNLTGPNPNAFGEVLLGYATITPAGAGIDTYVLANYLPSASGFTTTAGSSNSGPSGGNGFDLDYDNPGAYAYKGASDTPETFTVVSGVPEPATLGLVVVTSLGLMVRRRRQV